MKARGSAARWRWVAAPACYVAAMVVATEAAGQTSPDLPAPGAGDASVAAGSTPDLGGGGAGAGDIVPPAPVTGDTLSPRVGLDPGDPDLRTHLLDDFGTPPPTAPAPGPRPFTITPSVTVAEEFVDNIGIGSGGGADAITEITPGLAIDGATRRASVSLDYDPTAYIYASHGRYTQFAEAFEGSGQVVAIPDWLFVTANGSVSQQPTFGGIGSSSAATLSPDERQTVSTFSGSPYLSHSFGGTGTAQLGASYAYTATSEEGGLASALILPGGQVAAAIPSETWLGTERIFGNFTTGEDFGRFRNEVSTDNQFFDGTLAPGGGHRLMQTDTLSYAVTRLVALTGMIGFEDLDYVGTGVSYTGGVYAAGVILTPGRNSTLTLEYRHVDGFGSAYANGSVQVTPRIRVFGGYSEGISSDLQDVQATVVNSSAADGALYAPGLDAPVLAGSDFFGGYSPQISRIRRLDIDAAYVADRDTVSLTVEREQESEIGTIVIPGFPSYGSSKGITGSVGWRHQIHEDLSLAASLSYGQTTPTAIVGATESDTSATLELDRTFSNTLSGFLRYAGVWRSSDFVDRDGDQNSVTIGVTKTF